MPKPYDDREFFYYCPKCGYCGIIRYDSKEICDVCDHKLLETPHEYNLSIERWKEKVGANSTKHLRDAWEQSEQQFFDEVSSKSPEFNMELHNNISKILEEKREKFYAILEHGESILAKKGTPKCPTCQSTDVYRISPFQKAVGISILGYFSSDARNTMGCRNCGYKW